VRIDDTQAGYGYASRWFIAGNQVEGFPELTADNWKGGVEFETAGTSAEMNRSAEPFAVAPVTTQSAADAYPLVLAGVGANRPTRDAHDLRIIHDVETGTASVGDGIINAPKEVGGYLNYRSLVPALDSDHDGMPDAWERRYGLNPTDPADGNADTDKDGYSNVEEYLNGTDPKQSVDYAQPTNNVNAL
jgi:hypothetical protein